jgi:hypothetical protein
MGIVIDRSFDFESKQFKLKVHFYDFTERWDEWYLENDGSVQKIAPQGSFAEEPKDRVYNIAMMHRKRVAVTTVPKAANTNNGNHPG